MWDWIYWKLKWGWDQRGLSLSTMKETVAITTYCLEDWINEY